MFSCTHDPGMALFLAETATQDLPAPGPLEWMALGATVLMAVFALAVAG